ncbi:hypothetical protein JIY74_24645 [Vibrio harveyi]|nr:hypothetical protein [Vibrio harveyi]
MAISLTSEIFAKLRPTANQFLKGNDQDNKEIEFVVVISHLKNKDDKELAISINKKFEFGNVETA